MRPAASLLILALYGGAAQACAPVPPAAIDIDANSYYADSKRSVVDPVLRARNIAATRPTNDYLEAVARMASDYQAAPAGQRAAGQCGIAWLDSWAAQGAMLGKMTTNQSWYQRKWTLAGLALSYARIKPLASAAQRQRIEQWFTSLADLTMAHADNYKGEPNNHYYWEGLAVAASGAVSGQERHLVWGRKVFDKAMSQVAADGSLPREMERGVKALHYHLFAIGPLVMLSSILDQRSPTLDRLVQFTIDNAADPAHIEKKTGLKQESAHGVHGWRAIYERHTRGTNRADAAQAWHARMGGATGLANPLEHVLK